MRIVFVGTVDFSRHCLQQVLDCGGDVVSVLTLAKEDASFHADYADLSEVSRRYGVPVRNIKDINDSGNIEWLLSLKPDVIFVFGWSQLISKRILAIPSLGCIGTHPALLPRNRGRHPIIWALVEGLEESGLTFFYLDEGADSGDILWQKSFSIGLEDDAGSIYEKVKALAGDAIKEFLPRMEKGMTPRIPQDHSQATYWRKRTEKDGEINWTAPTMRTYNLIRALTHPYIGAHTYLDGRKIRLWHARLPREPLRAEVKNLQPGTIFAMTGSKFKVKTGDAYLRIFEYEHSRGQPLEIRSQLGGSL